MELNSEAVMEFGGFQKLTVLDFPEVVSCIVFTKGCNFRCPFCHNSLLVDNKCETYKEDEILSFLEKRKKVLDGIVISGGEPLMHDIEGFLYKVKELGYKIKIDTNGTYPEKLKDLVKKGLADYVAMDIKNIPEKYSQTAGIDFPYHIIKESIEFLLSGKVDYEFRTTVTKEFHTPKDIENIAREISGAKRYFIQNFVNSGNVFCDNLTPFSDVELEQMAQRAQKFVPSVKIR